MLKQYHRDDGRLVQIPDDQLNSSAIWYDLISPTASERILLGKQMGVELPTREEMEEIELSARLYLEDDAVFLTVSALSAVDTPDPVMAPVTFVLTDRAVITLRYHAPRALTTFTQRAERVAMDCDTPNRLLVSLLEAMVERIADILEREGAALEQIAKQIFAKRSSGPRDGVDLGTLMGEIGRHGELNSKLQESLVTFDRVSGFLSQVTLGQSRTKETRVRLKSLSRDVRSLTEHAGFQANKVTFLLDATLGLVSIQQNAIIKIFSVAAVIFLPPTMIASIYGMNFAIMPELHWAYGYPFAIGLMVLSAILPYIFFKRRGWL